LFILDKFTNKIENMTSIDDAKDLLKFVPFSSCVNPSFWFELNRIKLDDYKLNDDFKNITGFFNNCELDFSMAFHDDVT
jgi:hypothetical protein